MKGLQLIVFFTTCFVVYINAQMQEPGMQGGNGGYPGGGPGMQGNGGYPGGGPGMQGGGGDPQYGGGKV